MKSCRLHIIFFLLFAVCYCQISLSTNTVQQPEFIRQFDDDFKDRYSGNKFNYEGKKIVTETPNGSGKYEDYKNKKPSQKETNDENVITINIGPIGWLFYIAIALAVVYLVYILLNEGGSGLFSSRKNQTLNDFEEITAENIEHADIHALIKNAENENNYRLAIRYYYLLVLKTLSIKKHIKFEDDKTNSEYLNEISEKPFSKAFEYASYLYNYIWYGKFALNVKQYNKAKNNFLTLLNQVK
ncbi:hypothetical protein [Flavivirga eckloniae]|uniref:DUF4129 domain-containing protein n=1 Tax=Flavivirga eckloniae TaxID=1803846 RepID=A0A2K9PM39_9FLAO|nr:hypothetical protein [Flavivirga eckloniae]AUP78139.1 hypothetical protein C1H87_05160 [Flavivirga eckloniae]